MDFAPLFAADLQVSHVCLRRAADGLIARRRLEQALAGIAPSSLGLGPRAVLMVRRVLAATPLPVAALTGNNRFSYAVRADLQRQLRGSRRPWLDPGAAIADAVLFVDEAELIACLVRDWLRGAISEHWWWPTVLRGTTAAQWWRRFFLPRGDALPVVLEQLAEAGEAVAWLATWSGTDTACVTARVVEAYALSSVVKEALAERPVPHASLSPRVAGGTSASDLPRWTGRSARLTANMRAFERLLTVIPELRTAALPPAQRRLLALALGLRRASAWTRTESFAAALRLLEQPMKAAATESAGVASVSATADRLDTLATRARAAGLREATSPGAMASEGSGIPPAHVAMAVGSLAEPADADIGEQRLTGSLSISETPILNEGRSIPTSHAAPAPGPVRSPEPPRNSPTRPLSARAPSVGTGFGGIFYLLNVALALGMYGDFTQPSVPGIALSPWDWLALMGRTWFRRQFERDPVWSLLADLAGRAPSQPPGQDFAAPPTWSMQSAWLDPWGRAGTLAVYPTRERLQIWHAAGFVVIDRPLDRGRSPLAQARALCTQDPLRSARLRRIRTCPSRYRPSGRSALARWMHWLQLYLEVRLARALGEADVSTVVAQVCRHSARLYCTPAHLDVHLSLAALPLALRIAGLDRDPGWVPAAGRAMAFHFE